jgi:hypothetical protein
MSDRPVYTASGHGYSVGDKIVVNMGGSRAKHLREILARPRMQVIDKCTATTFTLVERRMTWREWFSALWRVLRYG